MVMSFVDIILLFGIYWLLVNVVGGWGGGGGLFVDIEQTVMLRSYKRGEFCALAARDRVARPTRFHGIIPIATIRTLHPSRPGRRWRYRFVCWTDYRPRGLNGPSANALLLVASFVRLLPLHPVVDGVAVVHWLGSRA